MTGAVVCYAIQRRADVPGALGWLADGEALRLSTLAYPARREAWLLGRWTAKQAALAALARVGQAMDLVDIEIRSSPGGAPEIILAEARAPLSLSLSHREDEAFAAVGPPRTALGVDLEVVEPRSAAFVADFFAAEERAAWTRAAASERDALACLVWSAKESALKALGEGLRRDTREVVIEARDVTAEGRWVALAARVEGSGVMAGLFRRDGARLLTVIADRPIAMRSIGSRRA